jgi:hypothetical protein
MRGAEDRARSERRIAAQTTWRERLEDAKVNGVSREYQIYAAAWMTCAVGEQHKLHPMVVRYNQDKVPIDGQLANLGLRFMESLVDGDPDTASTVLDHIEDRVLTLKRLWG